MNAKNTVPSKRYHALHLGPSGAGKTCAGVTVGDTDEKMSKVFIFDVDNRFKGIFGLPVLLDKIKAGMIEVEQYNQTDPNERAKKLMADLETVKKMVPSGQIDTIIFSSTTSATDLYREQARSSTSGIKHNILLGRVMTQIQDYGYIDRAHRDVIVSDLNKLSCNVVIESHFCDDGYTKETEEGDIFIKTGTKINLPGKLSTDLPTWFDETYEFFIDESIHNQPHYKIKTKSKFAKTSIPGLPVEIDWTDKNFFKHLTDLSNKNVLKATK